MNTLLSSLLTLLLLSLFIAIPELLAQPSLPTSPSQAPIDGGLVLLALGGGAYALKKLREGKNDIH